MKRFGEPLLILRRHISKLHCLVLGNRQQEIVDAHDVSHSFCLHYVLLRRINFHLCIHQRIYAEHRLRIEYNSGLRTNLLDGTDPAVGNM